jgi:SH3-like domain-containing protein
VVLILIISGRKIMKGVFLKLFLIFLLLLCESCISIRGETKVLYKTIVISKRTYVCEKPVRRAKRITVLKPGDYVFVLLESNRWRRVRTGAGIIGWVASRDLLKREQYREWEELSKKITGLEPQMNGSTNDRVNLRLRPGRNTVKMYQLNEAESVDIFSMAHTEMPAPGPSKKTTGVLSAVGKETRCDTWFLVRTSKGVVGWVYSKLINIDVPEELARYTEGKIIVAWRILSASRDEQGQIHHWYLAIEREQGSDVDFDRVRVLYWNTARKRYELAYRIKNIFGLFPFEAERAGPGKAENPRFKIRYIKEESTAEIVTDQYEMHGTETKRVSSISQQM